MKKKNIIGILEQNGWSFRRLQPIFKGPENEYISWVYEKLEDGTTSNYWQPSGYGDQRGTFTHWD